MREPERLQLSEEIREPVPNSPFTKFIGYRVADRDGKVRDKLVLHHTNGHGHGTVKFYNELDAGIWPLMHRVEAWKRATMRQHGRCDCYEFHRRGTCSHVETRERAKLDKTLRPAERRRFRPKDSDPHARDIRGNILDGDFDEYLKRLWEACGLQSKPYKERIVLDWSERYKHWLKTLHQRKEIEELIAGLKAEVGL